MEAGPAAHNPDGTFNPAKLNLIAAPYGIQYEE